MKRRAPLIFTVAGILLSVVPTVIAVCEQFPLWAAEGGEVILTGLSCVLLCLAALPLYRLLHEKLRSPSIWPFWLFLFVLLLLIRRVIDGLIAVCAVSFPAGLLGAVCFRTAAHLRQKQGEPQGKEPQ